MLIDYLIKFFILGVYHKDFGDVIWKTIFFFVSFQIDTLRPRISLLLEALEIGKLFCLLWVFFLRILTNNIFLSYSYFNFFLFWKFAKKTQPKCKPLLELIIIPNPSTHSWGSIIGGVYVHVCHLKNNKQVAILKLTNSV